MRVTSTTDAPLQTPADTIAVGVFDGEDVAHDLPTDAAAAAPDPPAAGTPGALQGLLEAGEARRTFKHLALTHAAGRRWLVVGLGERDAFDAERARVAAATVAGRARDLGTRALCWEVPHHVGDDVAAALVEGTLLADYRFERYRTPSEPPAPALQELVVSAHHDLSAAVAPAAVVARAQNAARDLVNTPANELTPSRLAQRAQELADGHDALSVRVEGREGIVARGMGAFAAVAQGSAAEPALITLRYEPAGADGPVLGLVGKAVTFDSGGLSIKPAASMTTMKLDMAGGAAVIEAMGAIAELGLPLRIVGVVGATENMVDGRAMRPGDVVRTMAGLTVEINNTDAEGRLVLADCLAHALQEGAQRLVDLATLTGAIVTTLGHTHAGLVADDDEWAEAVTAAGRRSGEIIWRLPLHAEYTALVDGKVGDVTNLTEPRVAGSITAAEFLRRFTGDVPWAHLDIAGSAWDLGRAYAPTGASGWGVRLLVDLARAGCGG